MTAATASFRKDINGLRAWAITLVLLFHFGVGALKGGFIGVDVFFVVSGYLMTSILLGDGGDRPTLRQFYLSRALRIVPALAVLVAVLMAFGAMWLSSHEYEQLAVEAAASMVGVSNHLFAAQAGYFDAAAHDKWLLHTWSLSVEAQFYVSFPLLLLLIDKVVPAARWRVLSIVAGTSLLASIAISPVDASSAFYLLPTRAWELLAGALVFGTGERVRLPPRVQVCAEAVGLALIVGSALVYSPGSPWPGHRALVPVVGTMLVVAGRDRATLLTSHPILQWIGSRSYSLYLWHWPVVVALAFLPRSASAMDTGAGIAASVILAALSYRLVEPLRYRGTPSTRELVLAGSLVLPTLSALFVAAQGGIPGRVPAADAAAREARNRSTKGVRCEPRGALPGTDCVIGGSRIAAVIVGDSHAQSVASALAAAAATGAGDGRGIRAWTYPSCITLLGARVNADVLRSGHRCEEFNEWVLREAARLPPRVPIVLVSRGSVYVHGDPDARSATTLRPAVHFGIQRRRADATFVGEFTHSFVRTACRLSASRPVFLLRPIPEMPADVPRAVARSLALGVEAFPVLGIDAYNARHAVFMRAQDAAARNCGAKILDTRLMLCAGGSCASTSGVRPLYYDDDHLSEFGNRRLVPIFREVFGEPHEPVP